MRHKCFISFKTEDLDFKKYIQNELKVEMIDKSLKEPIDSNDEEYIMKKIRKEYLRDSTVTIFLIGKHSSEKLGYYEQRYIKRELQGSLYNGEGNTRSGILGVVLPEMYDNIFGGKQKCSVCSKYHNIVNINDETVIKEFGYNYYVPNNKCAHSEEDRYCVLVKWEDFIDGANTYIGKSYNKRLEPIAEKVKVYPNK